MIKEFLQSNEINSPSFKGFERKQPNNNQPLRVRRDYDDYNDYGYEDLVIEDYEPQDDYSGGLFTSDSLKDNPKAVLNVVNRPETEVDFDKQLTFTPRYDKPLKVTRAPKKRQADYFEDEIPPFVVEDDKSEEIKRALSEEPIIVETPIDTQSEVAPEIAQTRDIKIDINNPESLPVPKLLNSYVISEEGLVTSQEAFDQLAVNVNKEIML